MNPFLKVSSQGYEILLCQQLSNLIMWCYLNPTVANYVSNVVSTVIPAIDASMVNIVPLSDRMVAD